MQSDQGSQKGTRRGYPITRPRGFASTKVTRPRTPVQSTKAPKASRTALGAAAPSPGASPARNNVAPMKLGRRVTKDEGRGGGSRAGAGSLPLLRPAVLLQDATPIATRAANIAAATTIKAYIGDTNGTRRE